MTRRSPFSAPPAGPAVSRARPVRRALLLALTGTVLAACGPAPDDGSLGRRELHAVLAELDTLAQRPDRAADGLVARQATPERLDKLMRMPQFAEQPFEIRRQAVALAGRGGTLDFQRPGEVLERLAAWFPERFGTPQARQGRLRTAANQLYGPYPDWTPQASAFMALWECMPAIAWEEPDANPFRQRRDDTSFAPLAATSSAQRDFGACVTALSGEPDHLDIRQPREAVHARAAAIGARAATVLQDRFHGYLQASGCSGRGPEDCVLVMWMWASLAPTDARLADTLRWLEPVVRPTGEPPPLSRPAEEYGTGPQEMNEPRFDEAMRKAAFLRAKLNSVLLAPGNWPADARTATFLQLAQLQAWFDANVDARWQPLYALDRQHDALNPWKALGQGRIAATALLDELDALPADTGCAAREVWFRHGGPALKAAHALRRLARDGEVGCSPDWNWLAQDDSAPVVALREQYLHLLDSLRSGPAFEALVAGLLAGCTAEPAPAWARSACARHVSQAMRVGGERRQALLAAAAGGSWTAVPLALPPPADELAATFAAQAAWLQDIARPRGQQALVQAEQLAAELERSGRPVLGSAGWRSPSGSQTVIELVFADTDPPRAVDGISTEAGRLLLLLDQHGLATISVPARFGYQYDDGTIADVTDLDGDGRPELWFSGTWGECDSDDAQPGIDCAVDTLHLGEIRGSMLSFYHDDRVAAAHSGERH